MLINGNLGNTRRTKFWALFWAMTNGFSGEWIQNERRREKGFFFFFARVIGFGETLWFKLESVCVLRVHVPTASKRAFPVQAEERPSTNVVSATTRREKYPTSESQIAKRRMGRLFRALFTLAEVVSSFQWAEPTYLIKRYLSDNQLNWIMLPLSTFEISFRKIQFDRLPLTS